MAACTVVVWQRVSVSETGGQVPAIASHSSIAAQKYSHTGRLKTTHKTYLFKIALECSELIDREAMDCDFIDDLSLYLAHSLY